MTGLGIGTNGQREHLLSPPKRLIMNAMTLCLVVRYHSLSGNLISMATSARPKRDAAILRSTIHAKTASISDIGKLVDLSTQTEWSAGSSCLGGHSDYLLKSRVAMAR